MERKRGVVKFVDESHFVSLGISFHLALQWIVAVTSRKTFKGRDLTNLMERWGVFTFLTGYVCLDPLVLLLSCSL